MLWHILQVVIEVRSMAFMQYPMNPEEVGDVDALAVAAEVVVVNLITVVERTSHEVMDI